MKPLHKNDQSVLMDPDEAAIAELSRAGTASA